MRTEDGELRQKEENTWAAEGAGHRVVHLSDGCSNTATPVSTSINMPGIESVDAIHTKINEYNYLDSYLTASSMICSTLCCFGVIINDDDDDD